MMGSPRKGIVIAFGRFNPPTTGHEALLHFVQKVARQRQHALPQDIRIYPSLSQDSKRNPLPFRDKLRFLRMLFPQFTFNDNPNIRTVFDAITDCVAAGYTDVTLIAGSDRIPEYARLGRYAMPPDSPKYQKGKHLPLYSFDVIGVPGERNADEEGIGGISASKQREFARLNDYESFKHGVPGHNDAIARMLFTSIRNHMNIQEHLDYLRRMRQRVTESYIMAESTVKCADCGHALSAKEQKKASDICDYCDEKRQEMREATLIPKAPTAVDNLKKKQKQEVLALKQRQNTELTTAQIRDLEIKAREQQQKMNAPKAASR